MTEKDSDLPECYAESCNPECQIDCPFFEECYEDQYWGDEDE